MIREEKKKFNIERKLARLQKKNDVYHNKIRAVRDLGNYIPLSAVNRDGTTESWADENSPTGYSQICSYRGICQSPCNGDC